MRLLRPVLSLLILAALTSVSIVGCHADDNDPAGQAKELEDPVRRANAIGNLSRIYTTALQNNSTIQSADARTTYANCEEGRFVAKPGAPPAAQWPADRTPAGASAGQPCGREYPAVKAIADAIHAQLTKVYLEHPEDNANRRSIINLIKELRDPRTLPALVKALDWRTEVSEDQAIASAQTLQHLPIPDDKKPEVVEALSNALSKVDGNRPTDNRMRIEFLRALGAIRHTSATAALVHMTMTRSESQSFLINILAAQQLGPIATAAEIPDLIQALFLFDARNPDFRMNDVAEQSLVRVGRPALQPLLDLLSGAPSSQPARAMAQQLIDAQVARNPALTGQVTVDVIVAQEAIHALGELGLSEALPALLEKVNGTDADQRLAAAIAVVRISKNEAQLAQVRSALQGVYNNAATPKAVKPQLIVAMRHMGDPGLMPFFLGLARDRTEMEVPDIRLQALKAYSLLANKEEAAAARAIIDAEPNLTEEQAQAEDAPITFRTQMMEDDDAILTAANECDQDLACWTRKLNSDDDKVVIKAAVMLARYGRNNATAIEALVEELGHSDAEVRTEMLYSADIMATNLTDAAVRAAAQKIIDKIEDLEETEQGRQVWNQVKGLALPTQARIRVRMPS